MPKSLTKLFIVLLLFSGCAEQPDPVGNGKVIILMYHIITDGEATDLYERSASDFESDLKYLKNNNIAVIGFKELEEMVHKGTAPLENKAIITFDDGDHSWLTNARPLLLEYDVEATFSLWVSQIGTETFLSWEEVDLLSHYTCEDGVRPFKFGSHTMSHPFLLNMKDSFSNSGEYNTYLDEELGGSKEYIETFIHGAVEVLALPYGNGEGDENIIAAARRNGYSCIRTSRWGAIDPSATDLYNLPSLPMLKDSEPEIIGSYLGIE